MIITIHDAQIAEPDMLNDCIKVCQRQGFDVVSIHCNERVVATAPAHRHPGWAEYLIIGHRGMTRLCIGAIQREVGATTEFHT